MVEQVGVNRFDDRNIIDHFRKVGQDFRDFSSCLPVFFEFEPRSQNRGIRLDERIPLPFDHRRWNRLPLQFRKCGFVIKRLQLTGSTRHE